VHQVLAQKAGFLQSLDALLIGRTAVALGAGRDKKSDAVDLSAGIILHKKPGDAVAAGEPLLDLHYNDASRLPAALALATQAAVIGDRAPAEAAQMIGWVHDSGEQMFVAL
jgi:thymidine phosphorylase